MQNISTIVNTNLCKCFSFVSTPVFVLTEDCIQAAHKAFNDLNASFVNGLNTISAECKERYDVLNSKILEKSNQSYQSYQDCIAAESATVMMNLDSIAKGFGLAHFANYLIEGVTDLTNRKLAAKGYAKAEQIATICKYALETSMLATTAYMVNQNDVDPKLFFGLSTFGATMLTGVVVNKFVSGKTAETTQTLAKSGFITSILFQAVASCLGYTTSACSRNAVS